MPSLEPGPPSIITRELSVDFTVRENQWSVRRQRLPSAAVFDAPVKLWNHSGCARKPKCKNVEIRNRPVATVLASSDDRILSDREVAIHVQIGLHQCDYVIHNYFSHEIPNESGVVARRDRAKRFPPTHHLLLPVSRSDLRWP